MERRRERGRGLQRGQVGSARHFAGRARRAAAKIRPRGGELRRRRRRRGRGECGAWLDGHWVYALAPGEDVSRRPSSGRPTQTARPPAVSDRYPKHITQTPAVPALDGLRPAICPRMPNFGIRATHFRPSREASTRLAAVYTSAARLRLRAAAPTCRLKICSTAGATRWRRTRALSGSSLAVLAILFEVGACNAFLDKFGSASRTTAPPRGRGEGRPRRGEWLTDATLAEYYHGRARSRRRPARGRDRQLLKRVEPVCERQLGA